MGFVFAESSMTHTTASRGWGWNGPVNVDYEGTVFIITMGDKTHTMDRTEIDSVGGTTITNGHSMEDIKALLIANFPNATGGAGGSFAAGSGTEWNGFEDRSISSNLDVTIGNKKNGAMTLTKSGSQTFKVYSITIATNNSGTNGGRTDLSYVTLPNGDIWVSTSAGNLSYVITPPAPDTTAPTVSNVVATDAHTIVVTFSEAATGTDAGWSFNNGSGLTITGVTGDGTDTWTFTISQTMLSTDTINWVYVASMGDTTDTADDPNDLADDSGTATNSISSGDTLTTPTIATAGGYAFTNASNVWTVNPQSGGYGFTGKHGGSSLANGTDGGVRAVFATSDTGNAIVGLHTSNTEVTYGSIKWGVLLAPTTGALNIIDNGSIVAPSLGAYSLADDEIFRIRAFGTVVKCQTSTTGLAGSWNDRHVYGQPRPASALWNVYDFNAGTGKVSNPELENFT